MRGYRLDPARTAEVLTPDGWLHTGDIGASGPDGRIRVVDRLKDLVITGGVNVSPTEVEAVLVQHPGVADACVVGVPDDEWGERVVVYVVPHVGRPRPRSPSCARSAATGSARRSSPRGADRRRDPAQHSGKALRRVLRLEA